MKTKMKKMIQKIKVILKEIWLGFSISNYIKQNHQQFGGYSYHDFEFPSGIVVRVQGYEPRVLTKLVIDYGEEDIVVGVQNIIDHIGFFHYVYENETHRYYPDIYIKSENRVVEVKSVYTFNKEKEKNLLKRDSVLNQGINFNFIIL